MRLYNYTYERIIKQLNIAKNFLEDKKMYDYLEAVTEDVRKWIDENINITDYEDREELEEKLNDDLFVDDSVTGNASGSYTFNTWQSEENLSHNWDILGEALEEFGETDINIIEKGVEWCDVTIRCYLLEQAISEVLDEVFEG